MTVGWLLRRENNHWLGWKRIAQNIRTFNGRWRLEHSDGAFKADWLKLWAYFLGPLPEEAEFWLKTQLFKQRKQGKAMAVVFLTK